MSELDVEVLREKFRQEIELSEKEIDRVLKIWEKEEKGELETIPEDEVWEKLG